MKEYRLHVL